jgi:ferric-dicitrate binding protein FerR (iron transport regulator)
MNAPMDEDDRETAGLLKQLKVQPSAAARERAFAKLQEEFQAQHAPHLQRSARRHAWRWAAAAGVVLALVAGTMWQGMQGSPALVARVEALDGVIESRDGSLFSRSSRLVSGGSVAAGTDLSVREGAGVLLRISPDLSVRLAENTQARFDAADELVLSSGQAFIDATPGAQAPLRVITPSGEVMHLGTQYQVRAGDHEVEVAVREGRTQLKTATLTAVTEAGHWLLHRDASPAPLTGDLAADDVRFEWIGQLPTGFKLEGSSLAAFLAWFHRETGLTPIYSDGIDAGQFAQVQLKGSIDDLEPFEALSYVLATADLAWHREGAKVVIEKRLAGTG